MTAPITTSLVLIRRTPWSVRIEGRMPKKPEKSSTHVLLLRNLKTVKSAKRFYNKKLKRISAYLIVLSQIKLLYFFMNKDMRSDSWNIKS